MMSAKASQIFSIVSSFAAIRCSSGSSARASWNHPLVVYAAPQRPLFGQGLRGANQVLDRTIARCAVGQPRSRVPAAIDQENLSVCDKFMMRENRGISSPRSPSGYPPPFQCSSRLWIACATGSGNPILRAIEAPLSHRIFTRSRDSLCCLAATRSKVQTRCRKGAPVATCVRGVLQALPTGAGPVRKLHVPLGPDLVRVQEWEQFGELLLHPASFSNRA